MKRNTRKGFTGIELVIVIAIIAILASALIPTFGGLIRGANETADKQAVREMNTYLLGATITGEVNSILDVYDIFEDSGFSVKKYSPLVENTEFYYDVQEKMILYVDLETGKVIYPASHEDTVQGDHDWYTLSMEIATEKINPTENEGTHTYSVSKPEQYAYIAETLSKGWPTGVTKVIVNITENIDFKGAYVTIDDIPDGVEFVFDGNGKTVKNMTSNKFENLGSETGNRKYETAALIGNVAASKITIQNVVFENINVKNTDSGNVALLVGSATGSSGTGTVKISNVDINNSSVIGHRSTGALVGMLYSNTDIDDVNLNNVNVYTVGGRSGLLYGFVSMCHTADVDGYTATNSAIKIYECEQNAGGIKNYTATDVPNANATKEIHSYSIEADGTKENKVYGFHENALYCKWNPATGYGSTYYLFALAQ